MRVVDPYELLVRWYLRFNGYLGVENFVVHETIKGGNVQGGETDILAVRFPHSRENPGFAIQNDEHLLDSEAVRDGLTVDFVVAEVKGRRKDTLNDVWRKPADPVKLERVAYLLRWLGPLVDEGLIGRAAEELQSSHRARRGEFLFRVVLFAHKRQVKLHLRQVTFEDIARFLACVRAPCWKERGFGARSPHDQWHPLIKDIWRIADPRTDSDSEARIKAILAYLKKAAEQRAGADSANSVE